MKEQTQSSERRHDQIPKAAELRELTDREQRAVDGGLISILLPALGSAFSDYGTSWYRFK